MGEVQGNTARTLTVDQAARELGVARGTAYLAIRAGQIPSIKIGQRILVPRAALDKLLLAGAL